ncbi:MAG: ribosome biogenesis factor YjgA [Gammaproteobacteria bacterium]|jgi:ribosome-associated protein
MTDRNHRSGEFSEEPSRTQRKRRAQDLQNTGKRLVELGPADLAKVPIPGELAEAIEAWKHIRSHEAQRRQLQFIGRIMRGIDMASINEALDKIDGHSAAARYEFHQLEQWRERLIDEPAALTEYLDAHAHADRQRLRHQLDRVRKAADGDARKIEARALFRLLRSFEENG